MNFYEKVIMFGHVPDSMLIGNRRINLTNKSRYAQYIYLSISLAFGTEWYRGLAPSKSRDVNVLGFINWINNYEEGELLEPNFLKEYETYRVVKEKVKPQSSGLSNIIGFLEASKPELHSINKKAYIYIKNILASTTVSFPDKREQYTLCDWFLEMEWLNSKMGDGYALLESPKILMSSFSLTVALLLSRIIKLKKQFRNIRRGGKVLMWVPENLISSCPSENSILKHHKNKKNDECNVNYKLMWVGENSEEIVLDPVVSNSYSNSFSVKNKLGFELFSAIEYMSDSDLIKLVTFESVTNEAKLLLLNYQKLGSQHRYFARPEILGPHSLYAASKVEEWLCAYLFAWLAVQPTDILNLKRNNIAIIKNKGGIANIQVKYFKGRAGMQMETMVLNCKYAEGKSILDYMDYYVDDSFFLKINSITTPSLNSFDSVPGVSRSLKHFFLCRSFTSSVLDEHEKRNLVPIFLSAMQKILTSPSRTRNVCSDMETYKKVNKEGWLQPNIFTLGRIKNSAVHSRSDKYRDDNIETDNSHSPETEKRTYLSDSNNDYIDRFGRVLRVVANAMVNLQYAPCSSLDIRTKVEKSIKTTIVEMSETNLSGANVGKYVNYLGIADPPKSEIHIDTNLRDILVLDTPETVVNMLHYIEDATKNQEFLLNDAPEFFYRTVLPNVEWMEWVLSIISTNSLHAGAKAYGNVKSFLPDLFVYELQGGIS